MVEEIVKLGIPSLVASDVSPAPSFVQKIAARFNVRTFVPERTMLQEEKSEIAGQTQNLHERDALAAAVKCYRIYANRLRQIELLDTPLDKDMLKHLVIDGFPLKNAMLMLEKKAETGRARPETAKSAQEKKDAELLMLAQENVNLRKALDAETKLIAAQERELERFKAARYAEIGRDGEVRRLRAQLEKMSWAIMRLKRKKN
ncbi:Uncharacterised protein [uncultured archaeon]|nr:Uncharacterised protein [uncultured archaeon]